MGRRFDGSKYRCVFIFRQSNKTDFGLTEAEDQGTNIHRNARNYSHLPSLKAAVTKQACLLTVGFKLGITCSLMMM
jgi:hypothetical protein